MKAGTLTNRVHAELADMPAAQRRRGDRHYHAAGRKIAEQHLRYTLRRYPHLIPERDDLTQTLHIAVWRAGHHWQEGKGSKLASWLFKAAQLASFDYHRRWCWDREHNLVPIMTGSDWLTNHDGLLPTLPARESAPDCGAEMEQVEVWMAKAKLTGPQRVLVQMVAEGVTFGQAAKQFGLSKQAMRSRWLYAAEKLRRVIDFAQVKEDAKP